MKLANIFQKIEKYLFYLVLFAIPFSIRKILYFNGWRFNEWQSISIHATDVLLVVLFIFWLFNDRQRLLFYVSRAKYYLKNKKLLVQRPEFYLVLLLVFSAVSIKNSGDILVSWFQWVKLLEFVILFLYLRDYAVGRFGFTNALFAIFFGGILQAIIAIIQFARQESIGLWYLGESIFNVDFTGIASFYLSVQAGLPVGEKIIRVYGTTPHPNVLAGYLFWAIFAFYFIWMYKRLKYDYLRLAGYVVTLWAFFLTFSRVAIFALGANYIVRGAFLFIKFRKIKSERLWKITFYTGLVILAFAIIYWPEVWARINISTQDDAVQLRNFYNKESVSMISWTGVGLGNFVNDLMTRIPNLPYYLYQPVHNIFLLIFAETGLLGISSFVLFLVFLVREFIYRTKMERFHHYSILFVFSSFLFMGFFDHFLWTLQQGRFLLWCTLALLAINENEDTS